MLIVWLFRLVFCCFAIVSHSYFEVYAPSFNPMTREDRGPIILGDQSLTKTTLHNHAFFLCVLQLCVSRMWDPYIMHMRNCVNCVLHTYSMKMVWYNKCICTQMAIHLFAIARAAAMNMYYRAESCLFCCCCFCLCVVVIFCVLLLLLSVSLRVPGLAKERRREIERETTTTNDWAWLVGRSCICCQDLRARL